MERNQTYFKINNIYIDIVDINLEPDTFNLTNFKKFRKFIEKQNVVTLSMSIPIANLITNISNVLLDILFEYLDCLIKFKNLQYKTYKFNNFDFKYGKLLYELIKSIIVLYLIFIIYRLLEDVINYFC